MNNVENSFENTFENIVRSWKICKNNHTYIKSIHNTPIVFNDTIYMNMIHYPYTHDIHVNKRTIYIDVCSNLDIMIYNKFNHIILVNCSNINLYIMSGLISGLDILHCNNINIFIYNNKINYTEISNSENCKYICDRCDNNDDNIYINTNSCFNIDLTINNQTISTNNSYFIEKKYFVINGNTIKCYDNRGNETNF